MWTKTEQSLHTKLQFKDFKEAFAFMTEVALHAERMDHHPNWSNSWNTVEINLYTHDAGNTVTARDEKLAEIISRIFTRYKS